MVHTPRPVKLTTPAVVTEQLAESVAVPSTVYTSVPGSVSFVEAVTLYSPDWSKVVEPVEAMVIVWVAAASIMIPAVR
jgi:hypothetical protein